MESGLNRNYNIIILTAVHPYKASGVVAYDLMQSLIQIGCNVQIITNARLEKKYKNTTTLKGLFGSIIVQIKNKIKHKFQSENLTDSKYYMFGIKEKKSIATGGKILKKIKFKPDAFIYLFPQSFIGINDLSYLYLKTKVPIFWYMMDMAPMTGGCHYAWDCLGYTKQCGSCPGIYSKGQYDQTYINWSNKFNIIQEMDVIPISASEWQFEQLKQSSLFKSKKHYKIYLPIDNSIFKPANKLIARENLNLPNHKFLVFFGAVSVNETRKGYKELIESLKILKLKTSEENAKNIHLVIAGRRNDKLVEELPFEHTFLGYLEYTTLATTFQAADIFVCPSIEDSGPMMINQSIMCGTPVVSFEMGVALDLVHTGLTGYRAKIKDCEDLAFGIKGFTSLNKSQLETMNSNCIELSGKLLQTSEISRKFKNLFSENLN